MPFTALNSHSLIGRQALLGALLAAGHFVLPLATPAWGLDGAPGLGTSQSDFGGVGLMQTPTARMAPAGELSFSLSRTEPFQRYNLSLQPLDWFEFTLRYVEIEDRLYGRAIAGDRDYLDKGMDAKFRLKQESRYWPEVAIGLRDAGGTSLFGGEYLVASKRWHDVDVSLGLGWGYLGERGDIASPLGWLDERFDDRPGRAGGDQGGEFALNQLFRGPAALFGGVEYQTPWEPLTLQLEYEGNDYQNEPAGSPITSDSPVNLGARYRLTDSLTLGLGWQRGNTAMASIGFATNLAELRQVKRDAPPVELNEPGTPPEGDWPAAHRQLRNNAGLRALRIVDQDDELVIEGEATRFRSLAKTAGRANRILHNHADADVEAFRYRWYSQGLYLRDDVHPRDAFVDAAASSEQESLYRHSLYSQAATGPARGGNTLVETDPERWAYRFSPGLNQNLGGPDGYLYQVQLRASGEYFTDANGWFSGELGWTVLDNLDDFDYIADSDLPRVRTFIGEYLEEGELGLTNLQYTRTARLDDDWFAMGYGGLLEMMYAGAGGELLYRPFNSPVAVGLDLNYVKQREFNQRFGLRDYETWTGHLSTYVQTGIEDVLAQVSVGRYLAGDYGGTLNLSREFDSGAIVGAWATFTDAGDDYGEGSFDKGIYVSLPLDAFFTTSTRGHMGIGFSPLTRDGGARLDRRYRLYDITQDRQLHRLWEETDQAWR
ncbi:YjbH domain-containing protein [Halomonas urmiana]|uniref:YjbH domain-containing protein n=1 Tax=Halomonas urmiana TaxID=490901 RepID=A0A5R8MEU1_9GAMM|nr:YjbH domain-containing protein [Halomonas urmiana]TLF48642.1 YjbH domain-containing protein [Halomonas urmiana]